MSARIKILLKFLLALALLIYLGSKMDFTEVWTIIASAKWSLVLVAIFIHFLTVMLSLLRWDVVVTSFNIRSRLRQLLQFMLIGYYFNLFLPTSMGGDVVRSYYLARQVDGWLPTILTTTFLDRFAGLFGLLLVGTVGIVFYPVQIQGHSLLPPFLILIVVFPACIVLLFNDWTHRQLNRLLQCIRHQRLEEKVTLLVRALKGLRSNPRAILATVVLSIMIQIVVIIMSWVAASALDLNAPFLSFVIFIPIINLVTMLFPLAINGLGVRESVYYLLFSEIGIPVEQAVVLSLLSFFIMNVPSLVGGVTYLVSDLPSKSNIAIKVEFAEQSSNE